jgi:hypothetical protein
MTIGVSLSHGASGLITVCDVCVLQLHGSCSSNGYQSLLTSAATKGGTAPDGCSGSLRSELEFRRCFGLRPFFFGFRSATVSSSTSRSAFEFSFLKHALTACAPGGVFSGRSGTAVFRGHKRRFGLGGKARAGMATRNRNETSGGVGNRPIYDQSMCDRAGVAVGPTGPAHGALLHEESAWPAGARVIGEELAMLRKGLLDAERRKT